MGIRLLNLNSYDIVDQESATLRIRPKMVGGIQPPDIFFRGNKHTGKPVITYADIINGTAVWNQSVKIDVAGTPKEYSALVTWWIDEARDDGAYGDSINERFELIGDVLGEVLAAKAWLIDNAAFAMNSDGEHVRRGKGEMNKYLIGWLNRAKKKIIVGRK